MYATQADLVDAFGEQDLVLLTDIDTPAAGAIVASRVDEALSRASSTVDSYLSARYQLPLAEVPETIKGAVTDLAFFHLHRLDPPEHVVAAQERAMRYLRDLAAGRAALQLASGASAAADPALPQIDNAGKVFGRSGNW